MTQATMILTVTKQADFYRAQAAQCAFDAKATHLQNVRERALRAEASWQAMAEISTARIASLVKESIAAGLD